jgi:hypothetical protein
VVECIMPPILGKRKWRVRFSSEGGSSFTLEPREKKDITMRLEPGENFSSSDLEALGRHEYIDVFLSMDLPD